MTLSLANGVDSFSQMPGITAQDCVNVRYIVGTWINHQGTEVAYLVKAPNIDRNRNDFLLYVKDIGTIAAGPGRLVYTGPDVSDVAWLGNGRGLTMLIPIHGVKAVVVLDAETGKQEVIPEPGPVSTYTMDDAGNTVAYGVFEESSGIDLSASQIEERNATGYRVSFGDTSVPSAMGYSLFVRRRMDNNVWGPRSQITIRDVFTHENVSRFRSLSFLSLSPSGDRVLFNYGTAIPADWSESAWVRYVVDAGNVMEPIMALYDLKSGNTTLAFKTVDPESKPLWSQDGKAFLVNAHSPVGSLWEQDDVRDHRISGPDANMFWVNADTGEVEEVYRHVPFHHQGALFWRDDGDVIIHAQGEGVLRLHRDKDTWRQLERIDLPRATKDRFWFTSNGTAIVGIHESVDVPQDLFIYRPGMDRIRILTDLNPQLKRVTFAPVRHVYWTTTSGLNMNGLLFVPPDYVPGKLYPLVIQTKGDQGWFTCDSGPNHDPSFAPQPIANAGIMYLARTVEPEFNYQDEEAREPKGYPGEIGEAVQQMDIWTSAVDALHRQRLVDPTEVGIIGFSRTGWYVEFMLTQSHFLFAAATAADSIRYSLGEYWLNPAIAADEERVYAGPPYGQTLVNWEKYSLSFSLERVHTPLLMEQMGYGVQDDVQGSMPGTLASSYEILGGLTRLRKPVEMYYYPNEDHQPDHPRARLASLQRNVDWYRFWLQGYEDPAPEKSNQYLRWRLLRTLHDSDLKAAEVTYGRYAPAPH